MKQNTQKTLRDIAKSDVSSGISNKFTKDHSRVEKFSFDLDGLYIDFSKTHISTELIKAYESFADEINFKKMRQKFFSGEKINNTENRAVLHTLLRDSANQGIETKDKEFIEQAELSEQAFFSQYENIIASLKSRVEPIKNIIHVGIGGSSLGTQLVFEALAGIDCKVKVHFIGNIDAHKLASVLSECNAQDTLLIGVSKTFTTAETLQNINSIGRWYEEAGISAWRNQLYAVTAKPESAIKFGIQDSNIVGFPEWVGGRYSVWSAVSLSAVIAFGLDKFKQFLSGASSVDKHFYQSSLDENVCFIAALLDHYYANFLEVRSRAIFPYDDRLRSLVAYLQQLETESNGKDRQRDGELVDEHTSVVVWGGVGTDVQHSVFQMMHQGTSIIPAEFILVKNPEHNFDEHHHELLANGLAQTAALLTGQDLEKVKEMNKDVELSDIAMKAKIFSGQRPSTTMLLNSLTPQVLGALLAFYEHRTFCLGVFSNINSYDQMGVELGKRLAKEISPLLKSGSASAASGFDASTQVLIGRLKS